MDELALLDTPAEVDGGLLIIDVAQLTVGLDDGRLEEDERSVALALAVAVADPFEALDVDADPVVLEEVALREVETLPLTELLLAVPESVLLADDEEERGEEVPETVDGETELLFVDTADPVYTLETLELGTE